MSQLFIVALAILIVLGQFTFSLIIDSVRVSTTQRITFDAHLIKRDHGFRNIKILSTKGPHFLLAF